MYRLVALLGLLLLTACAATPLQPTVKAEACTTGTVETFEAKAQQNELDLKGDYTGARLKDFVTYISQFVDPSAMLVNADRALVYRKDSAALILFFKNGCALGHIVGPWQGLEPYIGRSA